MLIDAPTASDTDAPAHSFRPPKAHVVATSAEGPGLLPPWPRNVRSVAPAPFGTTINGSRARLLQLLADEAESFNRLCNIAAGAGCHILVHDVSTERDDQRREPEEWRRDCQLSRLAAPVFDFDGSLTGFLDIGLADDGATDFSSGVARSILHATTRAIEERAFRQRYHREWIVALLRPDTARTGMLLALDRSQRIIGADRAAREALFQGVTDPESRLAISALFDTKSQFFQGEAVGDILTTLVPTNGPEAWPALITPPRAKRIDRLDREHAIIDTRPRLDSIGHFHRPNTPTPSRGGLPPGALRRVREHVEASIQGPIAVDTLARIAGLSRCHFIRAFKESMEMTPHSYVMHRRMAKAGELLTKTEVQLAEIAILCGFSDQSHLCRRFARHFGISPRSYRKLHR